MKEILSPELQSLFDKIDEIIDLSVKIDGEDFLKSKYYNNLIEFKAKHLGLRVVTKLVLTKEEFDKLNFQ